MIECTQVSFESINMDNDAIQTEFKDKLEIKYGNDWIKFSEIPKWIRKLLDDTEGGFDFLSEEKDIEIRIQINIDITFKIDGITIDPYKKGLYLHWKCKSSHTVGYREIQINNESLFLPIFPKFDIIMYEKMIDDLRKKLINIYKIEQKGHSFDNDACFPNVLERYKRISDIFKKLKKIMSGIGFNPHRTLVERSCYYELYELESCGEDIVVPLVTANRFIHSKVEIPRISDYFGGTKVPERILHRRKEITFDVYENRMLKNFISILDQHLSKFELFINIKIELYTNKGNSETQEQQSMFLLTKYEEIKKNCSTYRKEVREFIQMPIFENVSNFEGFKGSTPVLEKELNYSKFYKLYLEYKKNYKQKFDFPGVGLGLEDTPKLYEYWCLLKIMDVSDIEYDLSSMVDKRFDIVDIPENKSLNKNTHYKIFFQKNYQNKKTEDKLESYSGDKKPDIAVEIFDGKEIEEIVILDPKYRTKIGTGQNPEDNIDNDSINKMHVYKDSIVSKKEGTQMRRLIKKAVIVHPIDDLKEEVNYGTEEDFIKSIYLSPIKSKDSLKSEEALAQINEILSDRLNLYITSKPLKEVI